MLGALLSALSGAITWIADLLTFVEEQSRLATCSGSWLDACAQDFLGRSLVRKPGEIDSDFRVSVQREIFRERATRGALLSLVIDRTGLPPRIFEPWNAVDTGGFGTAEPAWHGAAFCYCGGWGSRSLPLQVLVDVSYRIRSAAAPSGWNNTQLAYNGQQGCYSSDSAVPAKFEQHELILQIARALPVCASAWIRFIPS